MTYHGSNKPAGFSKCRGCGQSGEGIWVDGVGPMHEECEKKRQAGLEHERLAAVGQGFGGTIAAPASVARDHEHETRVAFSSGATMSELKPRYDLICPTGLRRLAERYALGAKKHGDYNWCKAGDDKEFQRARLNHLFRHLSDYLQSGNKSDDNLAAIAWAAFALMHYEEHCTHHENTLP